MTKSELDDHMRDWFQRLSAKPDTSPVYPRVQIKTEVSEFKGRDIKPTLKRLESLGTTNSNTNEDNRNV